MALGALCLAAVLSAACRAPDPVVAGILASETAAGALRVRAAWAPRPFTNAPLPGYLRIVNLGTTADTLLGVESDVAEHAMLHGAAPGGGGGMTAHARLVIAPGDSLVLRPGGLHLMLERLRRPVRAGDTVVVALRFAAAGTVALRVPVVEHDLVEALRAPR